MSSAKKTDERLLPPLWVIVTFGLYAVWWLVSELRELFALLIVGYALAYVLDPLLDHLERKKISRPIGFFTICTIFVLSALLFFLIALPPLVAEIQSFISNVPAYLTVIAHRVEDLVTYINTYIPADKRISLTRADLMHYVSDVDSETVKKMFLTLFRFLLEGYSLTITVLNLTLLPFIVYYLAVDLDLFHQWCLSLFPRNLRKKTVGMFREIDQYLRAFVVGQTLVSMILTTLYCTGFAVIGHSQWLLMGVVAGVGNLVPYVGTVLGIVLGITFSLTSDAVVAMLIKTAIVFLVVQALEGIVITPKIVGEKVGLSPLLVILAILIGGKLFGLIGVFLAVPGAAVIRVLGNRAHYALMQRANFDL